MNTPKFYIYGVPDGFNMLSGTPDEILYYQLFYDTSKKGREMRINRKANGETVYSYLIYNLVACKGRAGAFLGMSIAFTDNEYCNNPVALKELFEGVYNEVILKADDNDKIVAAIDGGNAVGRFCITKFEERQEMCEKIGRIIINNVVGELAGSIRTIDASFDNSKEGRILTLSLDSDNNVICQALRSYTWVSLSSDCKVTSVSAQQNNTHKPSGHMVNHITMRQDQLSVHFINELSKKVGGYKDFIIQGLKGFVSGTDITSMLEEINHHLDTIEEYVGRQPELIKVKEDYMSIYNELVDLKPRRQKVPPQPGSQPFLHDDGKKGGIIALVRPYLSKIIAASCSVVVIAVIIFLWPSDDSKPTTHAAKDVEEVAEDRESGTDDASVSFNENEFRNILAGADYKAAWSMLQKVADEEKRKNFKLALQNSYREWFNLELKKRQNDLQALQELKEKIADYADFNEDNDRHNNLLDAYIKPIQERVAQKEPDRQERFAQQQRLAHEREQRESVGGEGDAGGTAGSRSRGDVIKIFKADVNYTKGSPISASAGNVILCKKNDSFVVEGATNYSVVNGDIQISRQPNGQIRIKAHKLQTHKVKLNQVVYTFNVTP